VAVDQQLGRHARGVVSSIDAAETVDDLCPQRAGRGGAAQAANDGFAYGSHGAGLCG
jgi:hypothetical protein